MPAPTIQLISLENLRVDLQNPRHDHKNSQRETLVAIAHGKREKLINLAEDIAGKGLNPSELIMVAPGEDTDSFTVLEGNRRVAALKLISTPSLVDSLGLSKPIVKRYKALYDSFKDEIPTELNCVVLSREDARYWIRLKHTGENEGVGIVTWDGVAKHRFRGSSPALQAIELVEQSGILDEDTKKKLQNISITNIERILGTPDARSQIGVNVENNKLIIKSANEEEALARLAMVVGDVAHRRVKVTQLDSKEQRVEYAKEVAARPLPPKRSSSKSASGSPAGTSGGSSTPAAKPAKPIHPERKTLVPKQFKIAIPHTRLNHIYHELQSLAVEPYMNSCAVMFRVFVELSTEEFAKKSKISLKKVGKLIPGSSKPPTVKDMTLREKIRAVADYLEKNGHCSKHELLGTRAMTNNREHFLSVTSLNAYVHNQDYHPSASDLKSSWDNVQLFIERLWTV